MIYYIGYSSIRDKWMTAGCYKNREEAKEPLECFKRGMGIDVIKEVSEEIYRNINFIEFDRKKRESEK